MNEKSAVTSPEGKLLWKGEATLPGVVAPATCSVWSTSRAYLLAEEGWVEVTDPQALANIFAAAFRSERAMAERLQARTAGLDVGALVRLATKAKVVVETPNLRRGPWIGLDTSRVVYGPSDDGRDDGNERLIVVYGPKLEARPITDLLLYARENLGPLADGMLDMSAELQRLQRGLAHAADLIESGADVIEGLDGDIDGESEAAREEARGLRRLAGAPEQSKPLQVFRLRNGDIYVARGARQAVKLWALDYGDTPPRKDQATLVAEDPLTLDRVGFSATARAGATAPPEGGPITKTLAEWVDGREPGLLWKA